MLRCWPFISALAESAEILPIFGYYHYPQSDTELKLSPGQIAAIARLPGIVGAKISTLELHREFEELVALIARLRQRFTSSGTALNLTQFLDAGGNGAMCPEAVVLPGQTSCAYRLYCQGQASAARDAQKELFVLAPLIRGGLTTERMARNNMMLTQDLGLKLPLHDHHPQARAQGKRLDGLWCSGTTTRVSCPLPGLSPHDRSLVDSVVGKVRERHPSPLHAVFSPFTARRRGERITMIPRLVLLACSARSLASRSRMRRLQANACGRPQGAGWFRRRASWPNRPKPPL